MPDGTETVGVGVKTSQQSTETSSYTEEQVKERERKIRSDVLAEAGRIKAEGERSLKAGLAALERVKKWEQEQADRELEMHKDDPVELKRIRAERQAKDYETELASVLQELEDERKSKKTLEEEKAVNIKNKIVLDTAAKFNVDSEKLIKLSKYTDGSPEAIEEIANDLPKLTSTPNGRPDSNRGSGGNNNLTPAMVARMTPAERFARSAEIAKMSLGLGSKK